MGLDGFMDDINILHGDYVSCDLSRLLPTAQFNLNLWRDLLQVSGGALNPSKCSWSPFVWVFDSLGNASLESSMDDASLVLVARDRQGVAHSLKRNNPSDAVRHLGVQVTLDGNSKKELQVLTQRNQKYQQFLQSCPLSRREARVIYKQCYLPAVTYPLPASFMPPDLIYKSQQSATLWFLLRMGYPRTLPRSVVYAPTNIGGLGFIHLGFEQGVQQTLQLLRHLRARTSNGQLYSILISSYQLYIGIGHPILEDNRLLPWSPSGWLSSIRAFLYSINSQIRLDSPWIPHDRYIMEDVLHNFSEKQQVAINNVRLYLRVTTLSEICDHTGTQVLEDFLLPPSSQPDVPLNKSGSSLLWPRQECPGHKAWQWWKKAIRRLYCKTNSNYLRCSLGAWNSLTFAVDWVWKWVICPTSHRLYFCDSPDGNRWLRYTPTSSCRTRLVYSWGHPVVCPRLPSLVLPVTPIDSKQKTSFHVTLPLCPINSPEICSYPPPSTSFISHLLANCDHWETPLWCDLSQLGSDHILLQEILNGVPLIISSDATTNAAKCSCFAWSISSSITLWKGAGIMSSPVEDSYAGRAEAFGIFSALRFLLRYLTYFPVVFPCALLSESSAITKGQSSALKT